MYYGSRAQVESYCDFHLLSSKANPLLPLRVMAQWYGPSTWYNKGCVTHCGLAIYIKKYLKAKEEELWKLKYISPCKNIIFKKPSKRNQNPSRYYTMQNYNLLKIL
jgi:hypothetical protein